MSEIDKLIIQRNAAQAKVNRFATFLDSFPKDNYLLLQERLNGIENLLSEFENIQFQIDLLENKVSNIEITEFENNFFSVVAKAKAILIEISNDTNVAASHVSDQNEPLIVNGSIQNSFENTNNGSRAKLPKIPLPTYSGESYEDWPAYKEMFQSLIIDRKDLPNIHKFYYLRGSLTKQAAQVIQALDITGDNFNIAWQLLLDRYENKKLIVEGHIRALFNLQKIHKENATALRKLLDDVLKHKRSLESLEIPVENWDVIFVYLITSKLDEQTIRDWEDSCTSKEPATFNELQEFLEHRCQALKAIESKKTSIHGKSLGSRVVGSATTNEYKSKCSLCNENHKIYGCKKFKGYSPNKRIQEAKRIGLCLNCLKKDGHWVKDCSSSGCTICNKRHNTLLHLSESKVNSNNQQQDQKSLINDSDKEQPSDIKQGNCNHITNSHVSNISKKSTMILATAIVNVTGNNGKSIKCRALLDSGSESNFIAERIVQFLQLPRKKATTCISGVGNTSSLANQGVVNCKIHSLTSSYSKYLNFIVLSKITKDLPSRAIDTSNWNIPSNIQLADPEFFKPNKIDMLIGCDIFWSLICIGQIKFDIEGTAILQKTTLGWIISGQAPIEEVSCAHTVGSDNLNDNLDDKLKKFWYIEECIDKIEPSSEEKYCEQHFLDNYKRDENGRFIVKLPLKVDETVLGDSKEIAYRRFLNLEKKFNRNPELKKEYTCFMKEYENLNHMKYDHDFELTKDDDKINFYLPHHGVYKESTTTKLRVVFDGSCKSSSGYSINDIMFPGPVVQEELFMIIARFRTHQFVVTADVEKMYRQVLIDESQQHLQLILWRENPNDILKVFRLVTVTYGTSPAQFLSTRCLKQLAMENSEKYPVGSSAVMKDFYVDDFLSGGDSLESTLTLQTEVLKIMQQGQFNLRKWCSNHPKLLDNIPGQDKDENQILTWYKEQPIKTLGLCWNPKEDNFIFTIKPFTYQDRITKRSILSDIFSFFDPLGLFGPIIIKAKVFLQSLWHYGLNWDESLPVNLSTEWRIFRNQLNTLNNFRVPRKVIISSDAYIELHGFADASIKSYAACIYARSISKEGEISVQLLCSKTRVAPIKETTIPRLELCGALLLARLYNKVINSISNLKIARSILWTDSTIVLTWITSTHRGWKTYVANRVQEISRLTEECEWKHIMSNDNPADIASRGILPSELKENRLWWHGASWLTESEENWPNSIIDNTQEVPEQRSCVAVYHELINFKNHSTWNKLLRIVAYINRFIGNCRKSKNDRIKGALNVDEIQKAFTTIIKLYQHQEFGSDISALHKGRNLSNNSKLISLKPFLDESGILRVGGRLSNAENLNYSQIHPIILPTGHIARLIARQIHIENCHAAPQLLLSTIRQQYWPLRGRDLARVTYRNCVKCFRLAPKTCNQIMGDLPKERLSFPSPLRAFVNTGIDYAGPILVKESTRRSSCQIKTYVAVFVCLATKAVHLELVGDLTTSSFIAALRRFIARRGRPSQLISDNGCNFVGANNELKRVKELLMSQEFESEIKTWSSMQSIKWTFIPPSAPNFGGIWEAAVKSFKSHLRRVLGNASFTFEELLTCLSQVEMILNSRPITPLSSTPQDINPLTPGHFLIFDSLNSIPEPDLSTRNYNTLKRWQRVQQVVQHFWKRWSFEYLNNLQQRNKWKNSSTPIQEGDIVIIKEDNLPPGKWLLGYVKELHPGKDGLPRVATIKTTNSEIQRPVRKLCILPKEDTNEEY